MWILGWYDESTKEYKENYSEFFTTERKASCAGERESAGGIYETFYKKEIIIDFNKNNKNSNNKKKRGKNDY